MTIHMKIEAKANVTTSDIDLTYLKKNLNITLSDIYNTFSKDTFQIHYNVCKLSKRARRNKV